MPVKCPIPLLILLKSVPFLVLLRKSVRSGTRNISHIAVVAPHDDLLLQNGFEPTVLDVVPIHIPGRRSFYDGDVGAGFGRIAYNILHLGRYCIAEKFQYQYTIFPGGNWLPKPQAWCPAELTHRQDRCRSPRRSLLYRTTMLTSRYRFDILSKTPSS